MGTSRIEPGAEVYDPMPPSRSSAGEHTTGAWGRSLGTKTTARCRCLEELFQGTEAVPEAQGSDSQEEQGESGAPWVVPTAGPRRQAAMAHSPLRLSPSHLGLHTHRAQGPFV